MAEFSPAQLAFIQDVANPFPGFVGGFGSGKTTAGMMRLMKLKIACRKQDVAYYLPTYTLIEDIAFQRFPELCELNKWAYKLNKQSAVVEFPGAGRILFRNMEHPHRIVGYEVAHSVVDELDILPTDKANAAWNKIIARNRQKCGMANTVAVATTPEGFKFIYEKWHKKPPPGYVLYRAKTQDNAANLPADYIENLRNTYPDNLLQAYLDGEFVNLTTGSIYKEFDRALNACDTVVQPNEPLHIGMDFNVGQMAAAVFVMRGNDPHAVDEFTGIIDTPAMIAAIKARYPGHTVYVYPDASGSGRHSNNASISDISLLREARFTVLAGAANPAVKDRIIALNRIIHNQGARRLKVNVDKCPSLTEALEKQAYDKNGAPDKSTGHDHINDAAGYMIYYQFPVVGRGISHIEVSGV